MKTSPFLLLVVGLILCTIGCEDNRSNGDPDKITGTGPLVTKTLDLAAFSKIRHTGVANFYIDIGSPQSVVLKAQQNIIDVMTWEVTGETLEVGLEDDITIENSDTIRFDITVSSMTRIELIGVGDFELSGPDQDALTINLIGVGDIHAFDMRVGSCTITFTGVGNCEVHVLNNLDVLITGVGNVYYKGSPEISSSITGVGQLIDAN